MTKNTIEKNNNNSFFLHKMCCFIDIIYNWTEFWGHLKSIIAVK